MLSPGNTTGPDIEAQSGTLQPSSNEGANIISVMRMYRTTINMEAKLHYYKSSSNTVTMNYDF